MAHQPDAKFWCNDLIHGALWQKDWKVPMVKHVWNVFFKLATIPGIFCVPSNKGCRQQCDQICQNSTTLANILKYVAIYLRFIWFWAKFSTHFGTIRTNFHCSKWPNIENTIWSHWWSVRKVGKYFGTFCRPNVSR